MSVLAKHIHQPPNQPHRLVALDGSRIRCLDCLHTLDLRSTTAAVTSTSTSPPPLWADDRCPLHPGQRIGTCGACRAEQLEATSSRPAPQPTADVTAGAAACRAVLQRKEQA